MTNIAVYIAGMRQVGLRRIVVADIPIACKASLTPEASDSHPLSCSASHYVFAR